MELRFWWLSLLLFVAVIAAWFFLYHKREKQDLGQKTQKLPIANTFRLMRLPEYNEYLKRYRMMIGGLLVVLVASLLSVIILAGRPTSVAITTPEKHNRDIVLCLDVSGSMTEADGKIAKLYAEMTKGFKGERLGLVLFDSSPITVFPLTDDYDFIVEQLEAMNQAFESISTDNYDNEAFSRFFDLISGVNEGQGSSLIGDGLASCVNRFDRLDSKRSRSIIFGTDNYLAGNPIVTLMEAAEIAKDKDVRVYGINPADWSSEYYQSKEAEEFKKAMLLTNGDYYKLDDIAALAGVLEKVNSQEATRLEGTPQMVFSDQPYIFLGIVVLGMLALTAAAWRLNL